MKYQWFLVALIVLGASRDADAKGANGTTTLDARVTAEVERTLPSGLAIASISVPDALRRHVSRHDIVALHWRRPPTKGRSVVQVLVHKRSGRIKKGWARVELVALGNVLVAAVLLEAGSVIKAGDLRVEERPQSDGSELQFAPSYLFGSRVVVARRIGETLHAHDVSMPMPIARGTDVRVIVRRGGVIVSTRGVLESKSRVGSTTRVRVAGRVLAGRLTRADLVELGASR